MPKILEIRDVKVRFGGLVALNNVSFAIDEGSIFGLIGPNGAGKSTLINVITGLYRTEEGSIHFAGECIDKLRPHRIEQCGITRTFQTLGLFPKMSVLENLLMGLHSTLTGNVFTGSFGLAWVRRSEREGKKAALEMLEYLGLHGVSERSPEDLPFGHCKLLELGRALLSEPKLLLLDEPTSGLSADESNMILKVINKIRSEKDLTIFIIEHNIPFIQSISDKLGVLNFGEKIMEGKPLEVLSNPEVVEAYLGQKNDDA